MSSENSEKSSVEQSAVPRNTVKSWILTSIAVFATVMLLGALAPKMRKSMSRPVPTSLTEYHPWPEETVDVFRELLIQDEGRVKPIDTFARFTQLEYLGKRTVTFSTTTEEVHRIESIEWLLDVLFRPEVARRLPTFVVDDSRAVEEIGVQLPSKRLRDRYSYGELSVGREKLAEKAQEYAKRQQEYEIANERQSDDADALELSRVQTMVLLLGRNVSSFDYLAGQMAFAQKGEIMSPEILPETMRTLAENIEVTEIIDRLPETSMEGLVRMMQSPAGSEQDTQLLQMSLQLVYFYSRSGDLLRFFPPPRDGYPHLAEKDILKPKLLAKRLSAPDASDSLSPWIWEKLSAEQQKQIGDESLSEAELVPVLVTAFNSLIDSAESIYEEKRFAAGSIEKVTRELMAIAPEGDQLAELNRKLLHDYYRSELQGRNEDWLTVGQVITLALGSKEHREWAKERLGMLADMVAVSDVGQEEEFREKLLAFKAKIDSEAEMRWEGDKAPLEVKFYKKKYFLFALVYFLMGFVFLSLSWLVPGSTFSKVMYWGTVLVSVIALGYLVTGITMRCIIRERPPITNLYETIIFIAAVGVIVGLFAELLTRMSIGLASVVILGAGLLFISIRYEAMEATDTMGQLQAVLDTNFWLATHVTIINIGYAAGLAAAIVSHFWILGKVFGLALDDKKIYKTITNMVYGIICFCLLFSLIGTWLGGIWANYSWGRFWGWDPKENGALMICLFSLAILHARMGGYIRQLGMHMSSIVLGIIVTFSWWGVNNLGVGLHSYGFVKGVWINLLIFWGLEVVFMILAVVAAKRPLLDLGSKLEQRAVVVPKAEAPSVS